MRFLKSWLFRATAACLALWLVFPTGQLGTAAAQQTVAGHGDVNTPSQNGQTSTSAADSIVAASALPETPEPVSQQAQTQDPPNGPPSDVNERQKEPAKPVGTAVAPYERTMGIAASRPAGAAIAPAKQRRVRTILISVGVIVGAGVAIGSVAALSHGSASRPH
jgi:hypothetical protein